MESNRILFIYNLELNLDSHVLASAHDWVEEFSKHYLHVFVYTTHAGRFKLPSNVSVIETGGGTFKSRTLATTILMKSLFFIFQNRKKVDVFHHMSSKTLLLLGMPVKIMNVPQVIWYSHSVADLAIRIGSKFAGLVVSATNLSIPQLPGIATRSLGHGISLSRLGNISDNDTYKREGIISVGRVVGIKRIENAIHAISDLTSDNRLLVKKLTLVGPYDNDSSYIKFLLKESQVFKVDIDLLGPTEYSNIPALFRKTSIVYTGTPKSADKAALEAAMLGCLILTTNESVQELTGMKKVLPREELAGDLSKQLAWMLNLTESELAKTRREIAAVSRQRNSLENLVCEVVKSFDELRGL